MRKQKYTPGQIVRCVHKSNKWIVHWMIVSYGDDRNFLYHLYDIETAAMSKGDLNNTSWNYMVIQ